MSNAMSRAVAWSGLLFALLLAGCSGTAQFSGECQGNADCPVGAACRITGQDRVGICVCRSDEACDEGEICNSQGICQERAGCRSNAECPADRFCDLSSGDCIERVRCGTDVHCPPGTICDDRQGRCVEGCVSTGDCPLYQVCARAGGELFGTCISGRCDDESFCAYGDFCRNGTCQDATNPNFCKPCTNGQNDCGDPDNFCLINSSYDPNRPENGSQNFCGVSCTSEDECPNGYECGGVVLLTQDQCTNDNECGGGGRQCVIGEGELRGFCTCVNDQDCAFESAPPTCAGSCGGLGIQPCFSDSDCLTSCDMSRRICQNPAGRSCNTDADCDPLFLCDDHAGTGRNICITNGAPCQSNQDCLCDPQGRCINTGRACTSGADCNPPCMNGGCVLGAACAPSEGLLCPDVR